MDFIDLTGIPYPALPEFVIVEAILAKYAVLGVIPLAIPPSIPDFKNPLDNFVKQQGTDYRYVTALAQQTGAVFYLDPGPKPGMSLAYWGPDISKMFGGPQPALSINFDAHDQRRLAVVLLRRHAGHAVLRDDHRAEHEDPDSDPGAEPRSAEGAAGDARADAAPQRAAQADREREPGGCRAGRARRACSRPPTS